MKFHSLRVAAVAAEAEQATALALEVPRELEQEFRGSPGQHIMLRAVLDGQEIRRTYSLVNAPGEWPLRILVRTQPGGRMSAMVAQLAVGRSVEALHPVGSFTPHAGSLGEGLRVAFCAGSGITPVLSVTRGVLAAGGRMMVFYGNRTAARTMGLEALQQLKNRYPGQLSLHFLMSREPQDVALYNGRLDGEKVRAFAAAFFEPRAVREFFLCGPGDMSQSISQALIALGVPAARIRVEYFTVASAAAATAAVTANAAPPAATPSTNIPSASAADAQVTVILDGRRRTFPIRIEEETVLEAGERAGLDLPFSCRSGVCSTCRTKVVRGEVRMAQNFALEDWEVEQGYVLACQSRCRSAELELDYDEK